MSHWSFYWHYESPNCADSRPTIKSTVGATVIANNQDSDFALLRLTEDPINKSGVQPYYAGWNRATTLTNNNGAGIHHPSGDIKKISLYTSKPISTNYSSNSQTSSGKYWRVLWSSGTTEGGSSGSPLFDNYHRIIGQLHGGYASCTALNQPDWFGKFCVSWNGNNSTNSKRRLRDWLDPKGTSPTYIFGRSVIEINVTGPKLFCDTGVFNVQNDGGSLPQGYTAKWTVQRTKWYYLYMGQNGLYTDTQIYDGTTLTLYNYTTWNPELYEISIEVKDNNGAIIYQSNIKATSGPPAPHMGTLDWVDTEWMSSQSGSVGYQGDNNTLCLTQGETTTLYFAYNDRADNYQVGDASIYSVSPSEYQANYSGGMSLDITPTSYIGDGYLRITLRNSCSNSVEEFKIPIVVGNSYYYSAKVYPNPVSDILRIEITQNDEAKGIDKSASIIDIQNLLYEIRLYDQQMIVLRDIKTQNKNIEFDVSDLPEGTYYLYISNGTNKTPEAYKVIIKH